LIVTEHRAHQCRSGCGTHTRADFPEGVTAPVQYGPRLAVIVVYLLHCQMLPEKRLAALMADLFGVTPSAATNLQPPETSGAGMVDPGRLFWVGAST
jgi:transposase